MLRAPDVAARHCSTTRRDPRAPAVPRRASPTARARRSSPLLSQVPRPGPTRSGDARAAARRAGRRRASRCVLRSVEPERRCRRVRALPAAPRLPRARSTPPERARALRRSVCAAPLWPWPTAATLAGVHPLELWLVGLPARASRRDARARSWRRAPSARQEVYRGCSRRATRARRTAASAACSRRRPSSSIHARWRAAGLSVRVAGALARDRDRQLGGSAGGAGRAARASWSTTACARRPQRIEELRFGAGTPFETRAACRAGPSPSACCAPASRGRCAASCSAWSSTAPRCARAGAFALPDGPHARDRRQDRDRRQPLQARGRAGQARGRDEPHRDLRVHGGRPLLRAPS